MAIPIISFLVPVFNHEKYVITCLNSLLKCAMIVRCELIVIDDGSTDHSATLIQHWLVDHSLNFESVFFVSRPNKGIAKTANEMLEKSVGEFIAPIASDDYLCPDGFISRLKFAQSNPNLDAVLGDAIVVDEVGNIKYESAFFNLYSANKKALLLGGDYLVSELIYRWSVVGPCSLIRRSVYSEIGKYNESLRVEDRDFYLRLLLRNKVCFFDGIVAAYRIHSKNFSRSPLTRSNAIYEVMTVNADSAHLFTGIKAFYLKSYCPCCNHKYRNKFFMDVMLYSMKPLRLLIQKYFDLVILLKTK